MSGPGRSASENSESQVEAAPPYGISASSDVGQEPSPNPDTVQEEIPPYTASSFTTETPAYTIPRLPNPIPPNFDYEAFFAAKRAAQESARKAHEAEELERERRHQAGEEHLHFWQRTKSKRNKALDLVAGTALGLLIGRPSVGGSGAGSLNG